MDEHQQIGRGMKPGPGKPGGTKWAIKAFAGPGDRFPEVEKQGQARHSHLELGVGSSTCRRARTPLSAGQPEVGKDRVALTKKKKCSCVRAMSGKIPLVAM